jgi:hypothetical protein
MSKYLPLGNGNQQANHKKAVTWFLDKMDGTAPFDSNHVELDGSIYRVTYSAQPDKLMLANTQHRDLDIPPGMDGVKLLALRQLNDGKLAGYRFEDTQALWDAREGDVTITWEKARGFAPRPQVMLSRDVQTYMEQ